MAQQGNASKIWPWLVVLGCIGFYSVPTGIIGNTSGIFVAPVMDEFGWSQTDTTMYRTIQPIVAAVLAPFAGKILQKGNPRWILTITTAAFGLGSVWSAYATEVWQWHVYGIIFGVTSAFFMYLACPVLINAWFKKNNGIAIAITAALLSLFAAVASPIGQHFIAQDGWQAARLYMSWFTTIVSVLLCVLFVRKDPASMGMLPWGADDVKDEEGSTVIPEEMFTGAEVKDALKSPALYTLILCCMIIVAAAAFFQQIPAFCTRGALGAEVGAMAVSIIMVGGIVFKLILGALNDIIGVQWTGIFSAACGAVGLLLAFASGANAIQFYIGMGIFGGGYAGLTVIAPMLARAAFGQKNYSQIYSWCTTGIFAATAVAFLVYAAIYDLTGNYDMCFYLVIGMYIVMGLLVPFTVKVGQRTWKK